jgi:hypothetical protein
LWSGNFAERGLLRSVPELSEHALDKSGRLLYFDRRGLAAFFERCENLLDFAINRESSGARFRENQAALDDHVKLA